MLELFAPYQEQLRILGYVSLSMLLGGVIGFERETMDKPAGLRTHMLIAGTAAMVIQLGDVVVQNFGKESANVQTDPIRIIDAVITGISFLGAGTIIMRRSEERVEGLTTAASVLFTAGLGIAVALSQIVLAIGATALVFFVLRGLHFTVGRMGKRK